jgi:hypothetical protein
MLSFSDDIFETVAIADGYYEHGHERGAGPSLLPDRARIDVSLPLELDEWLSQKAFERGLARAQLVRQILRSAKGAPGLRSHRPNP